MQGGLSCGCACVQFIRWPGKSAIVAWLDKWQDKLLEAYMGGVSAAPSVPSRVSGLPWANLTSRELIRVFTSETWDGQLDVNEFGRVLQRLLDLPSRAESTKLARQLFPCFDRDNSGLLDFREVFGGMALLCSDTREEKLQAVFQIMDANGSGRISPQELEQFLIAVCAWYVSMSEIRSMVAQVFREADTNRSGLISFSEVRPLSC